MVISKDPIRCNFRTGRQVIDFQYLGTDRNTTKEARGQPMKGARVTGFLRDITWKNEGVYLRREGESDKTTVRPVLTRGLT